MNSIAFLASAVSPHTLQWANALSQKGYVIHLITMHPPRNNAVIHGGIQLHVLPVPPPWGYGLNLFWLRGLLKRLKPQLLHVHYATGYGGLARLSGFHPTLLSVWGSDVLLFPDKSWIHRWFVRGNLRFADFLGSTSVVMKRKIEDLIVPRAPVTVTPLGVDGDQFAPGLTKSDAVVFGTVKSLEPVYGLEYLIKSFAQVVRRHPERSLQLMVVGSGSANKYLKELAVELRVDRLTEFVGSVAHSLVPQYLSRMSLFFCPSLSESFGVSVLEASACGLPVVASKVGGLPEVVQDGKTGRLIPPKNIDALVAAMEDFLSHPQPWAEMGLNGRKWVLDHFQQQHTVEAMDRLYQRIISDHGAPS